VNAAPRGGLGLRLLRTIVYWLLRAGWGLRVTGLERLPPPPYLIAPNHGSEIDALVLGGALPIRLTFLAARELERFPMLFRIIRWFDPVFVRRGLGDVGSVKAAIARLGRGDVLVIFPEGRVVQDQELGPLHSGAAFVALRAGVPVVPVALTGIARMWPLGARWPRPSRIAVRIGNPLVAENKEDADAHIARVGEALLGLMRESR
jgi:1-acyl-sn-glycerol-3-phosphate acyltransferase